MEKHSSNLIAKSFKSLFKRFHLLIFFVFIVGCLSAVVILVTGILNSEVEQANPVSSGSTSIDQATLQKVQSLRKSNATTMPSAPAPESNPFSH